jgi:hypothetical protein
MANRSLPHVIICMGERTNGQWFACSANAVGGDSPLHAVVKYSDQEYAPIGELEAAQRRVAEVWSEGFDACQGWLEPPDGKMGAPIPRNPYAPESLLTEKPADG